MPRPAFRAQPDQAEFVGHGGVIIALGAVDVELALARLAFGHRLGGGRPRVFHERAHAGGSEAHAAFAVMHFQAGHHAQAVGIALVGLHVEALAGRKRLEITGIRRITEPFAQRILAGMAERRIANVVRETGHLHDGTDVGRRAARRQQAVLVQHQADAVAKAAADTGHFQRVRQAVVDVVVDRERMHLRLARQPAEGGGEHKAVVVDVESLRRPVSMSLLATATPGTICPFLRL